MIYCFVVDTDSPLYKVKLVRNLAKQSKLFKRGLNQRATIIASL